MPDIPPVTVPVTLPTKLPVNVLAVTLDKPANDVAVVPNVIAVEPTVTKLFAKLALLIPAVPLKLLFVKPLIVLLAAAIVLLVKVCVSAAPTIV